ncbi:MAG: endonuclease domain-containing protein [Mycobacteriales bacterium]
MAAKCPDRGGRERGHCRACRRSERSRRRYRTKAYDMTPEEAAELIASQGGKCGICLVGVARHADHDHEAAAYRERGRGGSPRGWNEADSERPTW